MGIISLIKVTIALPPLLDSWKISGSFFIIMILLKYLSTSNYDRLPLLNSLIELRRNLILNKISFETAINQTDIVFSGLSISNILQDDIEIILEKEREISKILHIIASEYKATKNAALNNLEDKCTLCTTLTRSTEGYMKELKAITKEYTVAVEKYNSRSKLLLSMAPTLSSAAELKKIHGKISHSSSQINESFELVEKKMTEFYKPDY